MKMKFRGMAQHEYSFVELMFHTLSACDFNKMVSEYVVGLAGPYMIRSVTCFSGPES